MPPNNFALHEVVSFSGREFRLMEFKTVAGRAGATLATFPGPHVTEEMIEDGTWVPDTFEIPLDRLGNRERSRLTLVA